MQNHPLVLVSCTHCSRLHEPHVVDVSNPVCARCAAAPVHRPPVPAGRPPFGR